MKNKKLAIWGIWCLVKYSPFFSRAAIGIYLIVIGFVLLMKLNGM